MLKSSTKSVARDVVSTLIDPKRNEGALYQLTKLIESLPEYEEEADEEDDVNSDPLGKKRSFSKPRPAIIKGQVKRRSSRESSQKREKTITKSQKRPKDLALNASAKGGRSSSSKD